MKYLSLAFVAAVRAEFVDDDDTAALLRQLASHNGSNVTVTTTTTTTTTVTSVSANVTTTATPSNTTSEDKIAVTSSQAVAMTFSAAPTATADQTAFKSAVNKEVGKTYCASLSGAGNLFTTAAACYAAESSKTAAKAAGLTGYWNAEVAWTGGPTGFAVAKAAAVLAPSRRLTAASPAVDYSITATAMVAPANAATASASLTSNGAAFKVLAEATGTGSLGAAIKAGVEAAVANFTITAPTPTATLPTIAGVPSTSGATTLAASAGALFVAVASMALF